ncbi:MAG: YfhO family protein [Deltaproteobacteria bacterium]|nr:YfhO family protein [Deltaproteobacteria bacterium]
MSIDLPDKTENNTGWAKAGRPVAGRFLLIEIVAGVLGIGLLIYTLRSLLVLHETAFIHDHLYWGYPIFQFFAESIIHGHFPLWNPFTHGGEPFYPIVVHLRLLEPITLLTIYVGKYLGINDLVSLYNWVHFVQNIVMVFGVYIVFRTLAANIFIRVSLIPILLYFSFMFSPFRQAAAVYQFLYVPYIMYFLLRITYHRDYRWHNWLLLAALIGVNWQSYYSSGIWVLFLFFSLGLLLFHRDLLKQLLRSDKFIFKFAVALAIVCAMMLPNIVVLLEKDKYVFPARMKDPGYQEKTPVQTGGTQQWEGTALSEDHGILMPYSLITHTGTFSSVWDFVQTIYPEPNPFISGPEVESESGSEAYMYIGMLPWIIAVLGFVIGSHKLKSLWLLIAAGFGLLMLGPAGGLHRILYYVYPPLWFTRHTHGFVLFFLFTVLYFYVLGFNHIFYSWNTSLFPTDAVRKRGILKLLINDKLGTRHLHSIVAFILFSGSIVLLVYWMTRLRYPETHYLFLLIILLVIVGFIFRNDLGKRGIFASLVVGQICFVAVFCKGGSTEFLTKGVLLLGAPVGLFLLVKTQDTLRKKRYIIALLLIMLGGSFVGDLRGHLALISYLYRGQQHPKDAFNIKTDVHEPGFNQYRSAAPFSLLSATRESVRYLSLIYRQPYVFSPVLAIEGNPESKHPETLNDFRTALNFRRWTSFLLLRNYFALINSGIPPLAMKEMFCVGKPVFQFKQGIIAMRDNEVAAYLNKLGPEDAIQLLSKWVLINREDVDASLAGFEMSQIKSETLIDNVPPTKGDLDVNGQFSYSVKKYEPNSFSIDVATDTHGILYWSDGFDEGWRACVDGKEVPIYRANVNFKAIVLRKGVSHIDFVFKHAPFKMALLVFYGVLILAIILAITTWFYEKETNLITRKGRNGL